MRLFCASLLLVAALVLSACGGSSPWTCGDGTREMDGVCVAVDDTPDASGLTCGDGTREQDGRCVAVQGDAGWTCPPGSVPRDGVCYPADGGAPVVSCGSGTYLDDSVCVPLPRDGGAQCGPGTREIGGECLPIANVGTYQVRVAVQQIGADGYSRIPVIVYGTAPNGSPATDDVIISLSRASAGTVQPSAIRLTAGGSIASFVPCRAESADCLGTFELSLAKASDPATVIARSWTITLVQPTGVGSIAPCVTRPNVVYFYGDSNDWVHPGEETIADATFRMDLRSLESPRYLTLRVDASNQSWWNLAFSTEALQQNLAVNVYENAERAPFARGNHPGIDIGGSGRGCNQIAGRFQVHELSIGAQGVDSFLVSFEQRCEAGSAVLRGCAKFTR